MVPTAREQMRRFSCSVGCGPRADAILHRLSSTALERFGDYICVGILIPQVQVQVETAGNVGFISYFGVLVMFWGMLVWFFMRKYEISNGSGIGLV